MARTRTRAAQSPTSDVDTAVEDAFRAFYVFEACAVTLPLERRTSMVTFALHRLQRLRRRKGSAQVTADARQLELPCA